jgi:hypothetical protein
LASWGATSGGGGGKRAGAQALLLHAGHRELQRLAADKTVLSPRVYNSLDQAYRTSITQLDAELETAYQRDAIFEAEELRTTRQHLLRVERTAVQDLHAKD